MTYVAVTRIRPGLSPFIRSDLISEFNSRSHLIDALLTSCHVPFWLDGNATTNFEGGLALDGGLTNFIPVPPVKNPIRVACFPRKSLGSSFGQIAIAPDAFEISEPFSKYSMSDFISMALNPADDDVLRQLLAKGKRDAELFTDSFVQGKML